MSSVTLAVAKNPKKSFCCKFGPVAHWTTNFVVCFCRLGWKSEFSSLEFANNVNLKKSGLYRAASKEINGCFSAVQLWFCPLLYKFELSALFKAESGLFRDCQVMNSDETFLNQSWSVLNVSETSTQLPIPILAAFALTLLLKRSEYGSIMATLANVAWSFWTLFEWF